MRTSRSHWSRKQQQYWDSIALRYDQLYDDEWSRLEDAQTTALIGSIVPLSGGTILEVGCGTGLGYRLCSRLDREIAYQGLDISKMMLELFKRRHPNVSDSLICGSMSDLSFCKSAEFDAIIAINTALSFTQKPMSALKEFFRVLKPKGTLFVSVLSRWSLRRLVRFKRARIEAFKTRGAERDALTAPALTYSVGELESLLEEMGFQEVEVRGQSVFGGVCELPRLWNVDCSIAKCVPNFCHALNVLAKRL
jgi:ubiquinone/menaquinone biosynthesis C-methylase UbiE